MKGEVLAYDIDRDEGFISGEDGNRYAFASAGVNSERPPKAGEKVDFQASGDQAYGIFIQAGSVPAGSKSKIVAALLAFFLGGLGIHKFYLGYTVPGIIILVAWFAGIFLLFIPNAIIGIICLVEMIIYLTKSDEEFHQQYVVNQRHWF